MSLFGSMNISASGMTAQRLRMDTISQNIANANTTRTDSGDPYRRKTVVFEQLGTANNFKQMLNGYLDDYRNQGGGVNVSSIVEDSSPFITTYDPTHPDADEEGYVQLPNVNTIEEMTNLISANRSYEANITAFNASKSMISSALNIGR